MLCQLRRVLRESIIPILILRPHLLLRPILLHQVKTAATELLLPLRLALTLCGYHGRLAQRSPWSL